MSNRVVVYDSEAGDLIVSGIPIKDGRAEEFFTYEPEGDAFGDEIGADGHVVRYATHERRYKATIKLKGSSQENQKLTALHALDTNAANGLGIGPFIYKDNTGVTVLLGAQCWIVKAPPLGIGVKKADVEWPIRIIASPVTSIIGGN